MLVIFVGIEKSYQLLDQVGYTSTSLEFDSMILWKRNWLFNTIILGVMHELKWKHLTLNLKIELEQKRSKKTWQRRVRDPWIRDLRLHIPRLWLWPEFLQVVLQLTLFSHYFSAQFQYRISAAHTQETLGEWNGRFMSCL